MRMARNKRGRGSLGRGLVLGLLLPLAALVACFSLLPRTVLYGGGIPHVPSKELAMYGRWFDLRDPIMTDVGADTIRIGLSVVNDSCLVHRHGPEWTTQWVQAPGLSDTARVRRVRTMPGAYVVKFRSDAPWDGMRQVVLFPAGPHSLRRDHLHAMAALLGLPVPRGGYLRLEVCGAMSGIYAWEERANDDLLERHGMTELVLADMGCDATRPDHLMPITEDSMAALLLRDMISSFHKDMAEGRDPMLAEWVDVPRTIDVLLMRWLAGDAQACMDGMEVAYGLTTGRLFPAWYTAPRHDAVPPAACLRTCDPFTTLMRDAAMVRRMEERRGMLTGLLDSLRNVFMMQERTWGPLLSSGASAAHASGRMEMERERLLERLQEPIMAEDFGAGCRQPSGASMLTALPASALAVRWQTDAREAATIIGGKLLGDSLVLPRGKYRIMTDVVLPRGMSLVLEKGARVEMGPGVNVLVQGPLRIMGTRINPVFIRPADPTRPYGTLAVSANGASCVVQGLQMSGGSEGYIAGYDHSGMLSLHGVDLEMADCVIGPAHGEDGLNVKDGTVRIRDSRFIESRSDLIDLDRVTGELSACMFYSRGLDANGDGLDLSRSRVVVRDTHFEGMLDKGISVGEASAVLVHAVRFVRNSIALAVKDGSVAHVAASDFQKNALVFGLYRKKPFMDGGTLHLYLNTLQNNAQERELDALSVVHEHEAITGTVWRAFGSEPPEERRQVRRKR